MPLSGYVVVVTLMLCAHASIDSIIEEVEEEYDILLTADGSGKAPRPAWDDYRVENRNGTFVKYQLDMVIKKEHFDQLMSSDDDGRRRRRNAVYTENKLWFPRVIPYEIDDNFTLEHRYEIVMSIQHVMQHTCVVFKPHGQESDYIKFVRVEDGCYTYVGKVGDEHPINLAAPNCISIATIAHEIAHALGLYHEHMRNDRNNHVTVIEENIRAGKESQFRRMSTTEYDDYEKPYDYRSLMHYGKNYFGKRENGTRLVTMVPTQKVFLDVIGETSGLSFYDVRILNEMYKCTENCDDIKCNDDEFLGKNCECFCRGPQNDTAVPCSQEASCHVQALGLDPDLYYVVPDINLNQIDATVASGSELEVNHQNTSTCGYVNVTVTCRNGVWEGGPKPDCIKVRCNISADWKEEYFLASNLDFDREIAKDFPHGDELFLECLNNENISSILKCRRGEWEGIWNNRPISCKGDSCMVKYEVGSRHEFIDISDGRYIEDGENVTHAHRVEAICRIKDDLDGVHLDSTTFRCVDGVWFGFPPSDCPKVNPQCHMIVDATVASDENKADRYTVTCRDGYDMDIGTGIKPDTASVTCSRHGTWVPNTPVCKPATCSVPVVKNATVSDGRLLLPSASIVESGDHVINRCDHGYYSSIIKVTCYLGKWDSGMFPVCRKVVCGPPPVVNTNFEPVRKEYVYSDTVHVKKCKKNKEFVGDKRLTCQPNSTWSGTAKCQSYCANGRNRWVDISNNRFGNRGLILKANTFKKCKNKCQNHRAFLCLAISFGYKKNSRKPTCLLHKLDVNIHPDQLKEEQKWSVAKRTCVS